MKPVIKSRTGKPAIIAFIIATLFLGACGNSAAPSGSAIPAQSAPVEPPGKQAFTNNCMQCHALTKDKTGPMLAGVLPRWGNDTAQLVTYIRNSQAVIKAGQNKRIIKLYTDWHEAIMPPFASLTDGDIKDIINYINAGAE